jgi:hypothetical protein
MWRWFYAMCNPDEVMFVIRFVGIVLVIWGLIFQPLMAALPAQIANNNTHVVMVSDTGMSSYGDVLSQDIAKDTSELSTPPCHEESVDKSSSSNCDNCDCKTGSCTSHCAALVAAIQKSTVTPELKSTTQKLALFEAPTLGLPYLLFHPPKHS